MGFLAGEATQGELQGELLNARYALGHSKTHSSYSTQTYSVNLSVNVSGWPLASVCCEFGGCLSPQLSLALIGCVECSACCKEHGHSTVRMFNYLPHLRGCAACVSALRRVQLRRRLRRLAGEAFTVTCLPPAACKAPAGGARQSHSQTALLINHARKMAQLTEGMRVFFEEGGPTYLCVGRDEQ